MLTQNAEYLRRNDHCLPQLLDGRRLLRQRSRILQIPVQCSTCCTCIGCDRLLWSCSSIPRARPCSSIHEYVQSVKIEVSKESSRLTWLYSNLGQLHHNKRSIHLRSHCERQFFHDFDCNESDHTLACLCQLCALSDEPQSDWWYRV